MSPAKPRPSCMRLTAQGFGKNAHIGDDSQWGKTGTTEQHERSMVLWRDHRDHRLRLGRLPEGYVQMTTEYGGAPVWWHLPRRSSGPGWFRPEGDRSQPWPGWAADAADGDSSDSSDDHRLERLQLHRTQHRLHHTDTGPGTTTPSLRPRHRRQRLPHRPPRCPPADHAFHGRWRRTLIRRRFTRLAGSAHGLSRFRGAGPWRSIWAAGWHLEVPPSLTFDSSQLPAAELRGTPRRDRRTGMPARLAEVGGSGLRRHIAGRSPTMPCASTEGEPRAAPAVGVSGRREHPSRRQRKVARDRT